MALPLQDFATLVKTQALAVKSSCAQLVDVSVGSALRAVLEANASVGVWVQWLIVRVLASTRAETSTGSDLDSWVADFGMARFQSVAASGTVVFSRITPGLSTTIKPGVLVRTGFGTDDISFAVAADPSNPAWTDAGYLLPASSLALSIPVVAQQAGASGNVLAGAISMLATAVPGIDAVTNPAPMVGGLDAETDQALRSRFSGFLDSRTRATQQAVGFAIASVRPGLTFTVTDRVDASGAPRPGHFTVTVDDGTGAPSAALIAEVAAAVDQVRPLGSTFSIRPPLIIPVSVSLHVTGSATATAVVTNAIANFVSTLPIGRPLTLTRLYQIAYDADRSIVNAFGGLIDGAASDCTPPAFGLIRPATIVVEP